MVTSLRIVIRAGQQWSANGASMLGAALAYYALFSTAPLLLMVLVTGVLLLGSVAASFVVSFIRAYIERQLPGETFPWSGVEWGLSVAFLTILFGAMFRILSGRRISWAYVGYGAIVASLLFTVGKVLLSYYFVYASLGTTYGAAGSLVVFLVWVYYSSQTLFFGAELIQARRTRHEWLQGHGPNW